MDPFLKNEEFLARFRNGDFAVTLQYTDELVRVPRNGGAAKALIMPLAMTSVAGEAALWNDLDVAVRFSFADAEAAANGRTMIESYANIATSLAEGEIKPKFTVRLDGTVVTLESKVAVSEAGMSALMRNDAAIQIRHVGEGKPAGPHPPSPP